MVSASIKVEITERGRSGTVFAVTDPDGNVTNEGNLLFLRDALVETAKEVLKEEESRGFDPKATKFVDGVPNKKFEQVSPFGSIEIVARADLKEVIQFTYRGIVERSKIVTGEYANNNIVTYNGTEVANNSAELEAWLNTNPPFTSRDRIRFINTAPYARKLERHGITRQRSWKVKNAKADKRLKGLVLIPNGVYVLTARAASAKYGKNSFVRFSFVSGAEINLTGSNRTYKTDSGVESRKGQPYFYPSILISVIGSGIK